MGESSQFPKFAFGNASHLRELQIRCRPMPLGRFLKSVANYPGPYLPERVLRISSTQ